MVRYGFNIKTRSGQRVDNICIMAPTREDAERRLRQMYHHCEIIGQHAAPARERMRGTVTPTDLPARLPAIRPFALTDCHGQPRSTARPLSLCGRRSFSISAWRGGNSGWPPAPIRSGARRNCEP